MKVAPFIYQLDFGNAHLRRGLMEGKKCVLTWAGVSGFFGKV
jgi:hypothetical protein